MRLFFRIELFIYKLIVRFYRLRNDPIEACDYIIPHCYGLLEDGLLPEATRLTLWMAKLVGDKFPGAVILLISSGYLGEGLKEREDTLKSLFLKNLSAENNIVVAERGCAGTVTEVEISCSILGLGEEGNAGKHIIAICDAPHMRSNRTIWNYFLRGLDLKISLRSVDARWQEAHLAFLQRSPLRWLLANILRDIALFVRGMDYVGRISQPVRR